MGSLSPVELAGSTAIAAAVMVDFKNSRLLVPIAGNGLENLGWMAIARPAEGDAAIVALAASPLQSNGPWGGSGPLD